jgi:DNA repair/transcription protein MET18/MMS19
LQADPDRTAVVKGLNIIAKIHPTIIESTTLPPLFHSLPDHAPDLQDTISRDKYRSILHSLGELCIQPALFETLVVRITTKLDLLFISPPTAAVDGQNPEEERECEVAYAWDLLHCLSAVIEKKLEEKHVDVIKHFDTLVPRLYALCVTAAAPRVGDGKPLFRDRRLLGTVGRITERLVWELNSESVHGVNGGIKKLMRDRRQSKHFAAVFAAFSNGQMTGIIPDAGKSTQTLPGSPLRVSIPNVDQSEEIDIVVWRLRFRAGPPRDLLVRRSRPKSGRECPSLSWSWTIDRPVDEITVHPPVSVLRRLARGKYQLGDPPRQRFLPAEMGTGHDSRFR